MSCLCKMILFCLISTKIVSRTLVLKLTLFLGFLDIGERRTNLQLNPRIEFTKWYIRAINSVAVYKWRKCIYRELFQKIYKEGPCLGQKEHFLQKMCFCREMNGSTATVSSICLSCGGNKQPGTRRWSPRRRTPRFPSVWSGRLSEAEIQSNPPEIKRRIFRAMNQVSRGSRALQDHFLLANM